MHWAGSAGSCSATDAAQLPPVAADHWGMKAQSPTSSHPTSSPSSAKTPGARRSGLQATAQGGLLSTRRVVAGSASPQTSFAALLEAGDQREDGQQERPASRSSEKRRASSKEPDQEVSEARPPHGVAVPSRFEVRPAEPVAAPSTLAVAAATPLRAEQVQALAEELLRKVTLEQVGNEVTLRLELDSPRLSRLGLDLSLRAGRLHASFNAADRETCDLVRHAAGNLQAALEGRGLPGAQIEVVLQPASNRSSLGEERSRDHRREAAAEPAASSSNASLQRGVRPNRRSATDYVA